MSNQIELWVDALDFNNKGGWKEDTQFVHLMGSGYLIAAGEPGVPVIDASVRVKVPEKGLFRVWVRSRNWMRSHSPGKFNLLVDGVGNDRVLGAMPSDRWVWEIAGDYALEAGEHILSLHDLTGYFGRCASILLTTDLDYVPSPEKDRVYSERARIKGINTEVQFAGDYDVIVVGGGPGGVPAAIAAARKGCRVLLLQNRAMLGGNGSTEVGITFDGASVAHVYSRETGIAEEIRRLRDCDTNMIGDWTRAMEQLVAAEKNITVCYHMHVCSAEMQGNTIRSVTALNICTLEKRRYTAKVFVDSTGDAWLGYFAGAKYRCGREGRHEHGESMAPAIGDTYTMSGALKAGNLPYFYDTGAEVEYHAPEWVPSLGKSEEAFGRIIDGNGAKIHFWLETPNEYDDVWDAEETRDALLLVALGYYDFLKNVWSHRERAKNYKMDFVSVFSGHRESRRLIGDYVLTQNDCESGRTFDDVVTYTGWMLDIHHPEGAYSGKKGTMYCARHIPKAKVPYRCLYSKNIDNLFMAGRNISGTHIAIGTLRVENTIATMGQAVGTAAALCLKYGETPRGIYERHIRELQQTLIRDDQYIPGVKNVDERDPCLSAKATASSVCTNEIFETMQGVVGEPLPLDKPRCVIVNVSRKDDDIQQFYVKLCSSNVEPTEVTLHVCTEGVSLDTAHESGEIQTVSAVVPAMSEGWVKFPVTVDLGDDVLMDRCFVRIWLDAAQGVSVCPVDLLSFYYLLGEMDDDGNWKMQRGKSFRVSVEEPIEELAECGPENVINGWSRIVDAKNYEWVSDPMQDLPQWLELEFAAPVKIDTVSLVFDTDLSNPGTCWNVRRPGVPCCVKDYTVEVYDGIAWRKVAQVEGNFMRKGIHRFPTVCAKKIRITVLGTWGDRSARITEVRAEKVADA